jgi:uncharacterized protein
VRNPFEYGGIVGAHYFCNRVTELEQLRNAAANAGRLFITGERRVGKTSLLYRLVEALLSDGFRIANVDLWRCMDAQDFVRECAAAFGALGDPSPERLLDRAGRFFSGLRPSVTVGDDGRPSLLFASVPRHADDPMLSSLLKVPGILAAEDPDRPVLVIFDEFQQIRDIGEPQIERLIRSEVQRSGSVAWFFCGSRKHLLREMFLEGGSPLYRSAARFPIGPIGREEWTPFIQEKFLQRAVAIPDDVIAEICSMTTGHPYYTQMLCSVMWEWSNPESTVDRSMIGAALETVIRRESDAYHALWESLSVNTRKMLLAAAIEDPLTEPTSDRILSRYDLASPSSAKTALNRLVWKDIVEPIEDTYRVSDRFLAIWLRGRFQNGGR